MIKSDKRKYSICIASKDIRYFKHLEDKADNTCINCSGYTSLKCDNCPNNHKNGQHRALKEAQRLANLTGKKITVLTSVYNVYPDETNKTLDK